MKFLSINASAFAPYGKQNPTLRRNCEWNVYELQQLDDKMIFVAVEVGYKQLENCQCVSFFLRWNSYFV